jgi:predicted N-formylglutamate amidohydrolase
LSNKVKVLLTCEHGGNKVPEKYNYLFKKASKDINSHKGFDPGAISTFNFVKPIADHAYASNVTRLLVELNRSLHNFNLFSDYTKMLMPYEKQAIINKYFRPFRNRVEKRITALIEADNLVLHISSHSFTPKLNGKLRHADVGILFDPSIAVEKNAADILKRIIKSKNPKLIVKFNYPYKGTSDGFTTYLRQKYNENYAGLEIEVNQKYFLKEKRNFYQINRIIKSAVEIAKEELTSLII